MNTELLTGRIFTFGFEGDFNKRDLSRMEPLEALDFAALVLGAKKVNEENDDDDNVIELMLTVKFGTGGSVTVGSEFILPTTSNQELSSERDVEIISKAIFKDFATSMTPFDQDEQDALIDDWLDHMGLTSSSDVNPHLGVITWSLSYI